MFRKKKFYFDFFFWNIFIFRFVVDELVHDGFKASVERVTCRFSVRCQSCTLSGLYTAGGILAPRECQNIAHVIKFIWS